MATPSRKPVPALLLWGPVCLFAGLCLGRWLPPVRGVERVWMDARDAAQPAAERVSGGVPSLAPIVERVAPGVVTISALLPGDAGDADGAAGRRTSRGVRNGSGFVIHGDGLVVTSRHIVADARSIVVRVPGHQPGAADLVGEDAVTDLAVLRLQEPPPRLRVLELGRSEDLRAGDWIVTVGNPLEFSQTVTAGVVSFVGRHLHHYSPNVTNDFLQFSAPVNPGSSGGPVLDLGGRVVGVTTQAAEAAQGISFAIPSRTLKWVLDELDRSSDGRVRRGYLGIGFGPRSGSDDYGRRLEGALVTRVADDEPAHRAGLRPRDVVLYCDDQKITEPGELHERITRSKPGSSMRMTILREGRVLEPIEVTLGELAPAQGGLTH